MQETLVKSSSTSLAAWLHGQYIDRTFSQIVFTAARHTTCIVPLQCSLAGFGLHASFHYRFCCCGSARQAGSRQQALRDLFRRMDRRTRRRQHHPPVQVRNGPRTTSDSSPHARVPNTFSLEAQMETAQTVIDAYNAWDIDAILAYRTPDCQHQVLPSSMARAAQTNGEYRRYLSTIMPMFSNFTVAPPLSMVPCRVTEVGIGRGSQGDT